MDNLITRISQLELKDAHAEDFSRETFRVLKREGSPLVWGVPHVQAGVGGVGWGKDEGGMMKDEFLVAYGEDFTGETVHVVREKEVRLYGEYRTKCLLIRRILHETK